MKKFGPSKFHRHLKWWGVYGFPCSFVLYINIRYQTIKQQHLTHHVVLVNKCLATVIRYIKYCMCFINFSPLNLKEKCNQYIPSDNEGLTWLCYKKVNNITMVFGIRLDRGAIVLMILYNHAF
jgi:hypothetical protein